MTAREGAAVRKNLRDSPADPENLTERGPDGPR